MSSNFDVFQVVIVRHYDVPQEIHQEVVQGRQEGGALPPPGQPTQHHAVYRTIDGNVLQLAQPGMPPHHHLSLSGFNLFKRVENTQI